MAYMDTISIAQARRIALAAQGFEARRPEAVGPNQMTKLLDRIQLHQIDSVNVVSRAHHLPAFSRPGPYDRQDLDRLALGPAPQKEAL